MLPGIHGLDVCRLLKGDEKNSKALEEALEKLKDKPWDEKNINNEMNFISNKLGITRETLDSYLNLPLKTYKDYKSQKWIYFLGARIMKVLKLEVGGKR